MSDTLPPGAWQHTCMAPGDEAACRGCQAQATESGAPFFPTISEHGMDWRDGLDFLDRALDDCAQSGDDAPRAAIKVAAVREIVQAIRRWEDDVDDTISRATWEDAVVAGEPWADGEWRPDRSSHEESADPSNPPGATSCGGCAGLGSHRRWCRTQVGLGASIYGPMSERLGNMADQVGANNPGLANGLYALSSEMRDWARTLIPPADSTP